MFVHSSPRPLQDGGRCTWASPTVPAARTDADGGSAGPVQALWAGTQALEALRAAGSALVLQPLMHHLRWKPERWCWSASTLCAPCTLCTPAHKYNTHPNRWRMCSSTSLAEADQHLTGSCGRLSGPREPGCWEVLENRQKPDLQALSPH